MSNKPLNNTIFRRIIEGITYRTIGDKLKLSRRQIYRIHKEISYQNFLIRLFDLHLSRLTTLEDECKTDYMKAEILKERGRLVRSLTLKLFESMSLSIAARVDLDAVGVL